MADRLDEAMDALESAHAEWKRWGNGKRLNALTAARQAIREAAEDAADTAALHAADQAWGQIYALVGDDAFAATFQTLGQYRAALMDGAGAAGGGVGVSAHLDAVERSGSNATVPPIPADVRALVEELDDVVANDGNVTDHMRELIQKAAAALRATAEDRERLDWLEAQRSVIVRLNSDKLIVSDMDVQDGLTTVALHMDERSMYGPNVRAAIDAARADQGGTEG